MEEVARIGESTGGGEMEEEEEGAEKCGGAGCGLVATEGSGTVLAMGRKRRVRKKQSIPKHPQASTHPPSESQSRMEEKPIIRVVAVSGSLRKASYNSGLIRAAAEVCEESIPGMRVDHADISDLPLLNTDLETADGGFPPAVEAFRDHVRTADCFLFGSPEFNYSIATPLKNALDWASRGKNCWADKPAAIVSAGGGFGGGSSQYHLRQIGVFLDLHFINKPELFVQAFQQPPKFDSDGNLIDAEIRERIKQVLLSLQAFTVRFQKKD